MAATPESLLEAFLETRRAAESFETAELMAFIRANLPDRPDDETARKRQTNDLELLLEGNNLLFYRAGAETCYIRSSFFRGARFKIRPSEYEIREGLLFYGARFAPFCSEDIFADEYRIAEKESGQVFPPVTCPVLFSRVAKLFQMLGRSTMIDCIVADDAENYHILQQTETSEKAVVKLTAFDFAAFYRKHNFSEGDAVIVTVQDWETGSFEVEYAEASSLASQDEISAWLSDFEDGLIQAYEEHGEYLEVPDQIAHAYLAAFQHGHDLRQRPHLSLEEYPALMRDITIRRDGPEWTLVPVDEPTVSGGYDDYQPPEDDAGHDHDHDHGHKCSCGHDHKDEGKDGGPLRAEDFSASAKRIDSLEHLLEDLSAPLDYIEIYAMIQDDLANGQESPEEFIRKLIDIMGVQFADDAQEAAFWNFAEECWEEASEHFDPVIEEAKTPLRTRLLELNTRRLEHARMLVEHYAKSKIPKKTVDRMKDFHGRILNTLGLLNADRALENEEYEQLELRIGDLEEAWDEIEEQQER